MYPEKAKERQYSGTQTPGRSGLQAPRPARELPTMRRGGTQKVSVRAVGLEHVSVASFPSPHPHLQVNLIFLELMVAAVLNTQGSEPTVSSRHC